MTGIEYASELGKGVGQQVAGTIGSGISKGVGKLLGIDGDKDQLEQQEKLTAIQEASNLRQLEASYAKQQEMYDYTYNKTTPLAQRKNLEDAGMNPALMYGIGGGTQGQTGAGGTSSSGGSADGSASRKQANIAEQGMGIQMAMLESQIDLNKAQAEDLRAGARNKEAGTTTIEEQREILTENLRQSGIAQWFENILTEHKANPNKEGIEINRNGILNRVFSVGEDSLQIKELTNAIAKTQAETGNLEANKILTDKKAMGYYQELLNETMKAQAAMKGANASEAQAANGRIEALAKKLATDWGTGEYMNWKSWKDLGVEGVELITNVIGSKIK